MQTKTNELVPTWENWIKWARKQQNRAPYEAYLKRIIIRLAAREAGIPVVSIQLSKVKPGDIIGLPRRG